MFEQIVKWTMVSLMGLGALLTVSLVGKPRRPVTHRTAIETVITQAIFIVAILVWWD